MCWYLWARSIGKGCPFKSGTIVIEDEAYKLFSSISRLGYSRVLFRSVCDSSISLRKEMMCRIALWGNTFLIQCELVVLIYRNSYELLVFLWNLDWVLWEWSSMVASGRWKGYCYVSRTCRSWVWTSGARFPSWERWCSLIPSFQPPSPSPGKSASKEAWLTDFYLSQIRELWNGNVIRHCFAWHPIRSSCCEAGARR